MPQLAVETFMSQYIWLLITFFSFYFITIMYFIPQISLIRKTRELASAV
jgi:type II secretory pathway component PulF